MPWEHHLFQYCPVTAVEYQCRNGWMRKRKGERPWPTSPGLKQQCGAVQLHLHLTEFDLPKSKRAKVTKKGQIMIQGCHQDLNIFQLCCYSWNGIVNPLTPLSRHRRKVFLYHTGFVANLVRPRRGCELSWDAGTRHPLSIPCSVCEPAWGTALTSK